MREPGKVIIDTVRRRVLPHQSYIDSGNPREVARAVIGLVAPSIRDTSAFETPRTPERRLGPTLASQAREENDGRRCALSLR